MKKNGKLLIVDDNKSVLSSLKLFLKNHFEYLEVCSNPNQIPAIVSKGKFDVVLLDMNFTAGVNSGNEGLYWLKEVLKIDESLVVILFTAYGDVNLAVNAMKEGASDFILKPWDNKKLLATLQSGVELHQTRLKVEKLEQQKDYLQKDLQQQFVNIIGESDAIQKVLATVRKVASTDANVLILGENGTGKELIARELHQLSARKNHIFLGVDLGALSENLFESELFGHVKGAFTDAKEDRIGRFQAANKGSLFLDEIGNLSLPMQAKLLSALQNRVVTPIGSNHSDEIDVRLICATNANISKLIKEEEFREDLLYRINTITIELPPLRERGKDILILSEHFLDHFAKRYDKTIPVLDSTAKEKLLNYSWPGNIRELRHCIERAIILSDSNVLLADDFQLEQEKETGLGLQAMSLEEGEKVLIENALRRNQGNISQVAKELNIGRQTLYRKIEKYKIQ
ncbi:sigma-54-dependent transcriptional regulator [Marinifilum caeruleilacunae]|uniref:Sigma-54-dependent Fis family transcriptional regulator n=1 Tax=Marinifilum caeruleilacunae TaxID=2499076 RepID=A0ABX1WTZ9_9BACT|nr:sigma-54 dependent transcriptional regulator [Marinifilum caeruleilacunae]NOU59404.1 sigma-54-dependent Fis family transcriptional regulator [Marinifilum caeruleilacunae]